jgi:hypothetical protein
MRHRLPGQVAHDDGPAATLGEIGGELARLAGIAEEAAFDE